MKRSRTFLYLIFTDWIILVSTFAIALHFRPYDKGMNIVSRYHIIPEMVLIFAHALLMLGVFSMLGLYKRKIQLVPLTHFISVLKGIGIALFTYILAKGFSKSDLFIHSRWVMLYWGSLLLVVLTIHRLVVVRWLCSILSKTDMRRRVVVVGDTKLSEEFIKGCEKQQDCGMKVVGIMDDVEAPRHVTSVPFIGSPIEMPDVSDLYNLEGAVICNPELSHQKLMDLIERCIRLFGWVDVHSEKSEALQCSGGADAHFDIPFIRMHGIPGGILLKSWKRVFDFIASLCGIILLSPILIGTAIAIKLTSPGPIFYIKDRIGKDGKPFPFYKFRSMAVDADQDTERNEAIKAFIQNQKEGEKSGKVVNTAYVTPVGKFIRKWAIDELPQLFNVLKGDMALVGPRPVPPSEYEMEDEWHQRRFHISPGCTGLWKLYSANGGVTFNDTVLYDIYYARNMNPAMDIMVIFGTVWIILTGKADGQLPIS